MTLARVPVHTLIADYRDELAAHNAEALEFVDAARHHTDALEKVATEIGPVVLYHAVALGRLLDRYEARHLPQSNEPQPLALAV